MKIYNKIVIDMSTNEVLEEDWFEYDGELSLCEAAISAIVYFIIRIVIAVVIAIIAAKLLAPDLPDQEVQGVKANTRSSQEPLKVLYGRRILGCNDVAGGTFGNKNWTLRLISTLCEGEIEGLVKDTFNYGIYGQGTYDYPRIYFDDKHLVTYKYGSWVSVPYYRYQWVSHGEGDAEWRRVKKYRNEWRKYLLTSWQEFTGTGAQEPNTWMRSVSGYGGWNEPMHYTAYVAFSMNWHENKFPAPPIKQFEVEGLKIYNLYTGETTYSGLTREIGDYSAGDNQLYTGQNPAYCLYDFMTNDDYGLGIDGSAFIDFQSFIDAANFCEENDFSFNYVFKPYYEESAWKVVDDILLHFRGQLTWFDGKYFLKYADLPNESSVMTITDDHILQDSGGKARLEIGEPELNEKPDGIQVSYIESGYETNAQNNNNSDWSSNNKYIDNYIQLGDNAGVIQDFALRGCTNKKMATKLGIYELERRRLNRVVSGTFSDDCLKLEPFDVA
jgi:hypothetical protein